MSLRQSLVYSLGQTSGQLALKFFSNVILARLLLPEEIGVFAVAVAATLILTSLSNFGINRYVIQTDDLTRKKVATVYTVAICAGWSVAAMVYFGRQSAADFYDDARLVPIFGVMAAALALTPLGQPTLALMRREGRYYALSVTVLSATLSGAIVAITLAVLDFGPIAMAIGVLVDAAVVVSASLYIRPQLFGLRPSMRYWRDLVNFGSKATTVGVVLNIGNQAPELVIGRMMGFHEVGLFFRGQALARLGSRILEDATNWVMGAKIGAMQRAAQPLKATVLRTMDYLLVIAWPGLIFLGFKAEAIIALLYGENWLPVAPYLQVLALAAAVAMITASSNSVYEGTGAVGLHLRNETMVQSASVAFLFLSIPFGLTGVVWSRVALSVVQISVHYTVLRRYAHIEVSDMLSRVTKPFLISVGFASALLLLIFLEPAGMRLNPGILFAELLVMGGVYLALLSALRHPLRHEVRMLTQVLRRRFFKEPEG